MAYLDPPPFPAPVVVIKDVGGLVADYQARTEQYRREGREVRLHECRSACTLALGLPNVCVYPTSVLKFHKAYNLNTKERDEGVSAELFSAYPAPVQARLGGLTREYQALTGAELIALGVRDCSADRVQMARRSSPPSVAPSPANRVDPGFLGSIVAALTPGQAPAVAPGAAFIPVRTVAAPPPAPMAAEAVPLPPRRPVDLDPVQTGSIPVAAGEAPLPPRRPPDIGAPRETPGLPNLISGAQPTLPYGVLSYAVFAR